jgi:hypothetical protein
MSEKPKKTVGQLKELIMGEIRKHHECENITDVEVYATERSAPYQANWNCGWIRHGDKIRHSMAEDIASKYKSVFDLASATK